MNPLAQVYAVSLLYDSANALQRYHTRWPAMPDNSCQHNAGRVWQTCRCSASPRVSAVLVSRTSFLYTISDRRWSCCNPLLGFGTNVCCEKTHPLALSSEPGACWAPIFLKSNTYRYIGTLSLLSGLDLLIYWAPTVDFLTYWSLV